MALDKALPVAVLALLCAAHPYDDAAKARAEGMLAEASKAKSNPKSSQALECSSSAGQRETGPVVSAPMKAAEKLSKKAFQAEREKREARATELAAERKQRQKAAEEARKARLLAATEARQQAAKDRAQRMEETKAQRKEEALETLRAIQESTVAKQKALDEAVELAARRADLERKAETEAAKETHDQARMNRLNKWKNVVIRSDKSATATGIAADRERDTPDTGEETKGNYGDWKHSNVPVATATAATDANVAPLSPSRVPTTGKRGYAGTPSRAASAKVAISPMGVSLAMSAILHDYSDSDHEYNIVDRGTESETEEGGK